MHSRDREAPTNSHTQTNAAPRATWQGNISHEACACLRQPVLLQAQHASVNLLVPKAVTVYICSQDTVKCCQVLHEGP